MLNDMVYCLCCLEHKSRFIVINILTKRNAKCAFLIYVGKGGITKWD